jgi:hypothetical protein
VSASNISIDAAWRLANDAQNEADAIADAYDAARRTVPTLERVTSFSPPVNSVVACIKRVLPDMAAQHRAAQTEADRLAKILNRLQRLAEAA